MEESGSGKNPAGRTAFSGLHYYLQDELGSPMRVSGFRRQDVLFTGRSDYLTYGYDENGNDVWYFYDPEAFKGDKVEKEVEADIKLLEEKYHTEVHPVTLNSRDDFIEGWNGMDEGKVELKK